MPSAFYTLVSLLFGILHYKFSSIPYYFKCLATRLCLRIYKYVKKNRLDVYDPKAKTEPERVGFLAHPNEIRLESPCSELHLAQADDAIFLYGINSKSECLLVSIVRLSGGEAEATIFLSLANGKTYQLEKTTDFQQTSGNKKVFSCGGLQMYYLCPMRRWRVFYSGYLKETIEDEPNVQRMVYVRFSFLWRASSDVFDSTSDMNENTVTESVSKLDWRSIIPPINRLYSVLDFYAQAGVIMGTINVEQSEEYEMYLFGHRIRQFGDMSLTRNSEISHFLGFVQKNGMYIHVGEFSAERISRGSRFGFIVEPSSAKKTVETMDVTNEITEAGEFHLNGTIKAGRSYKLSGSSFRSIVNIQNQERYVRVDQMHFEINGKKGLGIFIKRKTIGSPPCRVIDISPLTLTPEPPYPLVVKFSEKLCKLPEITEGKGSSLGMLAELSGKIKNFTVPNGFVITTSSYSEFITDDIQVEIKALEKALYCGTVEDAKEICKRVHNKIVSTKFSKNVRESITMSLKTVFGENCATKKLAIRSSATGEDTDQMSAAGQMDTFLGVSGLSNILIAVKKCWASQFSFVAVQYKRRYGQPLHSLMAVIVQEMVSCDVAGVLFTCDPVSGNPTKMSIAANFGLGESVASGSEEPDTIELTRDYNDQLKIHQITVGSKSHKVVVTDDGTGLNDVPESERQICCLGTETALRLGHLAIAIEKYYKSRRDIEWGIQNETLYIFQSRPVTSGTQETDFEIEHELDGPLRTERDFFSVSNAGEVMPGAMTTLSLDMLFRTFAVWWQADSEVEWQPIEKSRYFPVAWMTMRNHCMFSVGDLFKSSDRDNQDSLEKATMVSFFGRILDDEEIYQVNADRHAELEPKTFTQNMQSLIRLLKSLIYSGQNLKKAQKKYSNYRIPTEKFQASKELFYELMRRCGDIGEALKCHMICSQSSTFMNMLILTVLSRSKNDYDDDVYTDFASLVTNKGEVESADVPSAIQSLAFHITNSIYPKEFKAMMTEDALHWLQTTSASAGKKFKEFITKHGHRCLKEWEISSVTWGSNPKPLVEILQRLAGSVSSEWHDTVNNGVYKLIKDLKVPTSYIAKLILLLLVPLSRKAVRERESSKSLSIRGIDALRKGYRRLVQLMVSEGRIPNEDIFYFFTLEDLRELLETRSPSIPAKAYHRQRLHPKMESYIFPEIMKGFPRPVNEFPEDIKPEEGMFCMKGIPVSQGVAKGYVRVCVSLQDAAGLIPGEIMLAYSTDIGWTPYFPTLAGVATELGGLISHGAVVSREYGLPCVAGLHGATRRFKTGDYVLLDGNKGILQKMLSPEEDQNYTEEINTAK